VRLRKVFAWASIVIGFPGALYVVFFTIGFPITLLLIKMGRLPGEREMGGLGIIHFSWAVPLVLVFLIGIRMLRNTAKG
jgi:hypothetical protein